MVIPLCERRPHPVVEGPHAAVAQLVAVVANEIAPFERPIRAPLIPIDVAARIAGQPEQFIDEGLSLFRIVGRQERRDFFGFGQRADAVEKCSAKKLLVAGQRRRL